MGKEDVGRSGTKPKGRSEPQMCGLRKQARWVDGVPSELVGEETRISLCYMTVSQCGLR